MQQHGIRRGFLSSYIGGFEEELLTHITLPCTGKHCQGHASSYFLFIFLTKSTSFQTTENDFSVIWQKANIILIAIIENIDKYENMELPELLRRFSFEVQEKVQFSFP